MQPTRIAVVISDAAVKLQVVEHNQARDKHDAARDAASNRTQSRATEGGSKMPAQRHGKLCRLLLCQEAVLKLQVAVGDALGGEERCGRKHRSPTRNAPTPKRAGEQGGGTEQWRNMRQSTRLPRLVHRPMAQQTLPGRMPLVHLERGKGGYHQPCLLHIQPSIYG